MKIEQSYKYQCFMFSYRYMHAEQAAIKHAVASDVDQGGWNSEKRC